MADVLSGDPLDVAFGDYLAEITLASLVTRLDKDASRGYVARFFEQFKDSFDAVVSSGTRIVTNAGGFNPQALAEDIHEYASGRGVELSVAYVLGDNLLDCFPDLVAAGHHFTNMDTGKKITNASDFDPISVDAYLGGWGIAKALAEGAQIVVTGRVADASLVVGSAAWFHGWRDDELDKLAGALAAAHITECGPQAVGGNFSGFDTLGDVRRLSFPIAEIHEDGSAVIGKHSGQNGKVTVDTVTAQLLYEIQGPYYLNNDVTLDVRSVHLEQVGEDRVRVSGAKGSPPPETTKVSIFAGLGYQSASTAYLTGLQVAEKTAFVESQLADFLAGTGVHYDITRIGVPAEHPSSQWEATVVLRVITVADEAELLERYNIGAHLASVYLSGVPGYYCDEITGDARSPVRQRIEYWPGLLDQSVLDQRVEFVNGGSFPVGLPERIPFDGQPSQDVTPPLPAAALDVRTVRLGDLAYARSGDKGGVNNVGVWVKDPADYEWLRAVLSIEALRARITELKEIEVERHEFPNLNAVHFLFKGLLGTGGSSSLRVDRLGKAVGEYLRTIPVPDPRPREL
ncbi:DUF1446 domain-containing protein [Pseudonocardia yunnanensis]